MSAVALDIQLQWQQSGASMLASLLVVRFRQSSSTPDSQFIWSTAASSKITRKKAIWIPAQCSELTQASSILGLSQKSVLLGWPCLPPVPRQIIPFTFLFFLELSHVFPLHSRPPPAPSGCSSHHFVSPARKVPVRMGCTSLLTRKSLSVRLPAAQGLPNPAPPLCPRAPLLASYFAPRLLIRPPPPSSLSSSST